MNIPLKVFDPRFKIYGENPDEVFIYLDRDNSAKIALLHEDAVLTLKDVTEIELILDGVKYLNSQNKIFNYSSNDGFIFINFNYFMKIQKGKHKIKIILYTENHKKGVVWVNDNMIFNIQ